MAGVLDIEDVGVAAAAVSSPWAIAASARTDIPACYLKWFMDRWSAGVVEVKNPMFPTKVSRYGLEKVELIAWWSKNYGPWIARYLKGELPRVTHYFNFTINSESELEKGVGVGVDARLEQLKFLTEEFGVDAVNLRFDPIVLWRDVLHNEMRDNLADFEKIVEVAASVGVREVSFSFCEPHRKTKSLMLRRGKVLVDPPLVEKKALLDARVLPVAHRYGVTMRACCSSQLVGHGGIVASACVDLAKVTRLFGGAIPSRRKGGLRGGCNCLKVVDIGSYMECANSCDYCYANPKK